MGRIRLEVIPDVQMETLEKGVEALVEPGSKVVTDGWAGYNSLEKNGYRRLIESASGWNWPTLRCPTATWWRV